MLEKNQIVFVTYLLYQLADAWHMSPSGVYKKLSEAFTKIQVFLGMINIRLINLSNTAMINDHTFTPLSSISSVISSTRYLLPNV